MIVGDPTRSGVRYHSVTAKPTGVEHPALRNTPRSSEPVEQPVQLLKRRELMQAQQYIAMLIPENDGYMRQHAGKHR